MVRLLNVLAVCCKFPQYLHWPLCFVPDSLCFYCLYVLLCSLKSKDPLLFSKFHTFGHFLVPFKDGDCIGAQSFTHRPHKISCGPKFHCFLDNIIKVRDRIISRSTYKHFDCISEWLCTKLIHPFLNIIQVAVEYFFGTWTLASNNM